MTRYQGPLGAAAAPGPPTIKAGPSDQYGSLRGTIEISDNGADVVLDGRNMAMVFYSANDPTQAIFRLTTEIGGALSATGNVLSVDDDDANTQEAATYHWKLWDVDDKLVLAKGTWEIAAGPAPDPETPTP